MPQHGSEVCCRLRNKMIMNKIITAVCCGILSLPLSGAAQAHKTARDSVRHLDEVSVTAIKQSVDISLHPQASTVVGAKRLERLGVVSLKGLSAIAPNFYVPDYGSRMTSSIYVRGIGARIDQPVVGLNVDNVPFLNKDAYDFDLPDISRMEIIRGPQSTLYGRNTMGGLINIYTLSPFDYTGSRVMAETGKGPIMRFSASQYAMLRPDLGMSLAGQFFYSDGFFVNNWRGYKADKEKGGSLRWKTEWRPSKKLNVENIAAYSINRTAGYPYEYEAGGEINYNDTCFYRRNILSDGLTVKWNAGKWSLSSITSGQYIVDDMTLDQDFLPLDYFTLTQKRHEWAVTQDFIARGTVGSSYRWLAGAFGFYKRTSMHAPVTFKGHGIERLITDRINQMNPQFPIRWNAPEFVLGSDFTMPVYGLAAYHQSDFTFGRWQLSAGLRLDYERSGLDYRSFASTGYTVMDMTDPDNPIDYLTRDINIDDRGKLHKSFVELLPKVSLSYRLPMPSESDVYLSVGKGYKAGGFNTQMFSDVLQQRIMGMMGVGADYDVDDVVGYKPERSWNYEVGAHVACADGRVLTDLALFYIDCRDQQLTMFPDGTTTGRITTNAGKTRSYGAEVQISYRPTSRWLFNLSYGYTNARFVDFYNGRENFKGKRVPYAPQNTLFGGLTYTQPINRWLDWISFSGNVRGVGSFYWDEENVGHQPFYAVAGASVEARHDWLSVSLWGENLTSTKYTVFSFKSIGNTFVQRGKPLTWGVTLRMTFAPNSL